MHRRYAPPPPPMSRGVGLRLASGLLLLALLFMLINWVRNPDNWQWLVRKPAAAAPPRVAAKSKPLPKATGPTDEDRDEAETARENFQALTDGTIGLGPEEMVPYDQVVDWVRHQSFARLNRRARHDLWYTDLYNEPDKYRGKLVALDVDIRMTRDVGKNDRGVKLYEAWGMTEESRGRPYAMIVVDYPKGMPAGHDIHINARFAGYFLKLQGYEPAKAKPGQRPERAPLLIGRLQWTPPAAAAVEESHDWAWGIAIVALFGAAIVIWYFHSRQRGPTLPASRLTMSSTGDPVDQWLDTQTENGNGEENES